GAIGEQLELLANAVLGLAAGAVELLIEGTRVVGDAATPERGDDEARIGALERVLGLADDPARAAPAVDRAILEVAEHARRPARGGTETLRLGKLIDQRSLQAAIARQAKHVVDAVRFTPTHQLVIAEAAVAAQDDAHARPAPAELGNGSCSARSVEGDMAACLDRSARQSR